MADSPAIPLARWASRHLRQLAQDTGSTGIAALTGQGILAERSACNDFTIPGLISAGGGCRLLHAADGWVALNLARPDDRDLLPALIGDDSFDPVDDEAIASRIARIPAGTLLQQGRILGLALASGDESPASPAIEELIVGPRLTPSKSQPLVIDLSALWAGPLAAHLLWLAGAQVVKVESRQRPDAMRQGDPGLFALLNQGKDSVLADLETTEGRAALLALLHRADVVIEAARPRALKHLGIDAEEIVRARPGVTWITITGHGATGPAADWVGFGDDCGVAGGLSAALAQATGRWGFVGDAIADPLTGIVAAREAWRSIQDGSSRRIGVSLSGVVTMALAEERAHEPALLEADLREWAIAQGQPVTHTLPREPQAAVHGLGSDSDDWLVQPC